MVKDARGRKSVPPPSGSMARLRDRCCCGFRTARSFWCVCVFTLMFKCVCIREKRDRARESVQNIQRMRGFVGAWRFLLRFLRCSIFFSAMQESSASASGRLAMHSIHACDDKRGSGASGQETIVSGVPFDSVLCFAFCCCGSELGVVLAAESKSSWEPWCK